jgi:hypothetical protein
MSESPSEQTGSPKHDGSAVGYILALTWGRLSGLLLPPRLGGKGVGLFLALIVLGWLAAGLYNVQPDEEASFCASAAGSQPSSLGFTIICPIRSRAYCCRR